MTSAPGRIPRPAGRPAGRRPVRTPAAIAAGVLALAGFALFAGCLAGLALNYRLYRVPTDSMTPEIRPGDRVLVQRDGGEHVVRGDIVAFTAPEWTDTGGGTLVKRVVAIGGDTVSCCDPAGRIVVAGHPVDEPWAAGPSAPFEVTVPPGRLFVLGDNRVSSRDSRARVDGPWAGTVAVADVVGRADRVVWPAGRSGDLRTPDGFRAAGLPGRPSEGPARPLLLGAVAGLGLLALVAAAGAVSAVVSGVAGRRGVRARPGGTITA